MNCIEVAEYVSALFDGEPISREAAVHLSDCAECRGRLNRYAEIGAELRRMASAGAPQTIPEGRWKLAEPPAANDWLRKWRGTMRIPRFAFALMLFALLALSMSMGLFLTRAKETARWFQYELLGRDGKMIMSGTAPTNPGGNRYYDPDGGMGYEDGTVWLHVRILEQAGEAEKIGVRAMWVPLGDHFGDASERLRDMPEREFLYSPGEDLRIPVDGYGNLEIKGHFESTLPENVRMGLYPEDGRFRIDPPVVLVREKEMLMKGKMGGGQLWFDKSYFAYGAQDEGWYLFSAKPLPGAVEGTLTMNQIEFTLHGKQYFLFTGDPILFGQVKIWVKHYASIRDADQTSPGDGWQGNIPRLAFGQLENLSAEK